MTEEGQRENSRFTAEQWTVRSAGTNVKINKTQYKNKMPNSM